MIARLSLLLLFLPALTMAAPISPSAFVGHEIGADRELVDWDTLVRYLRHLDAESPRVEVEILGSSTQGRDFLLVRVADEEGLAGARGNVDLVRSLMRADELGEDEARRLAESGRPIVALSMGLHSVEVAASQASLELLYRLAVDESPAVRQIRRELIVLVVPSMNPDGMDIVVDWYRRTKGTPAEGSRPPWLYHPYAGHDNNRDGFFNNLVETALWSRVLYHDWLPQVILDEHQMGSRGPRLFLPPFDDPLSPSVHPLVYSQLAAAGQQMVSDLTAQGHTGIATSTIFTAEWPGSVRSTAFWHNMLGILSEVASARLATPLYFPPGSLRGAGRGLPAYERRTNFLQPWPGGWWRLRDCVQLDLDLSFSLLRWCAQHREDLLYNWYQMSRDALERGRTEPPYGFAIGLDQPDPGSADRLVELLLAGGLRVEEIEGPTRIADRHYARGAYVVRADQPFRPFLLEMLDSPPYPELRTGGGEGERIRPYDGTAWRLPDLLGVRVESLPQPLGEGLGRPLRSVPVLEPELVGNRALLPATDNASFAAANALLDREARVERVGTPSAGGRPGDFLVEAEPELLREILLSTGARAREAEAVEEGVPLRPVRIGLYAPWGGSMDEGWTRLVLERHGFQTERVRNADLTRGRRADGGRLAGRHDVILLPAIGPENLEHGQQREGPGRVHEALWPEEYRGGLGGLETGLRLRSFVEKGGTLVALGAACDWVVEKLGLPVEVELQEPDPDRFAAPGTLLRAEVDVEHALGWGMQPRPAVYFGRGRAFRPLPWPRVTAVPARYAEHDLKVAGYLVGGELLQGRPALLDLPLGEGHVVLFGFSPQRRAQTEATFKLLFNALMRAGERRD